MEDGTQVWINPRYFLQLSHNCWEYSQFVLLWKRFLSVCFRWDLLGTCLSLFVSHSSVGKLCDAKAGYLTICWSQSTRREGRWALLCNTFSRWPAVQRKQHLECLDSSYQINFNPIISKKAFKSRKSVYLERNWGEKLARTSRVKKKNYFIRFKFLNDDRLNGI